MISQYLVTILKVAVSGVVSRCIVSDSDVLASPHFTCCCHLTM